VEYPPLICGADPGSQGGIAFLSLNRDTHKSFIEACSLPDNGHDLYGLLEEYAPHIVRAYVERVRSSPQMGVTSAFTFGRNYERILSVLSCSKIPFEEVLPAKWQRSLSCLTHGDKNVTKTKAQQLFPTLKVTHKIADALLIAEYGRRQWVTDLNPKELLTQTSYEDDH
jgi:hypothetical protein